MNQPVHESAPQPPPFATTCAIIAGALMLGVVIFAGVVMVLHHDKLTRPAFSTLEVVALLAAAGCAGVSRIVPAMVARQAATQASSGDPEAALRIRFQTGMLVEYALLEGAALFALVTTLVTHASTGLYLAGMMVALMATRFPTPVRIAAWMEENRSRQSG